ncbi:MAG TPA: DUF3551 domain-containing protein [Xanthobacteraceae bacterium]|jgi:hypothetical protein
MRIVLATAAMLAAFAAADAGTGSAQAGAWCARYFGHGGTNCGFYTYEQCRVNVSGIGGFCEVNAFEAYPSYPYREPRRQRYYRY